MKPRKPLSLSQAFCAVSHHPARRFELANHFRFIAGRYKIPDGMTAHAYEQQMKDQVKKAILAQMRKAGVITPHIPMTMYWEFFNKQRPPACLVRSWKKLRALNPCLGKIRIDQKNIGDLYDAHMGVTSGFNIDDMNFYIEQGKKGYAPYAYSRHMPDHGARLTRIERATGSLIDWVVSPATGKRIEARLKRRGKM